MHEFVEQYGEHHFNADDPVRSLDQFRSLVFGSMRGVIRYNDIHRTVFKALDQSLNVVLRLQTGSHLCVRAIDISGSLCQQQVMWTDLG